MSQCGFSLCLVGFHGSVPSHIEMASFLEWASMPTTYRGRLVAFVDPGFRPSCIRSFILLPYGLAGTYWGRRSVPGWHTIIRGLAPQAGGFRRRPNKNSSVGLSAWLIVVLGRLPCALQVVACHLQSVSYLNTCQAFNPGSEPVASHEQYITNKYAFGAARMLGNFLL